MAFKKSDLDPTVEKDIAPSGLEVVPPLEQHVDERLANDYRSGGQVVVRRRELAEIVQELAGHNLGPMIPEEEALVALYRAQGWDVEEGRDRDGLFLKFS